MGTNTDADDWEPAAFGSRKDRAILTVPPFLIGLGLVYLFGFHFADVRSAGSRQVLMAAAVCVSTLWWLDTYRRRIRATFPREIDRAYFATVAVAIIAAVPAVIAGLNGLAAFGACVGYLAAFTYARFNWRAPD